MKRPLPPFFWFLVGVFVGEIYTIIVLTIL